MSTDPDTAHVPGICRLCHNLCGVLLTIADGRVVHVTGDPDSPGSEGYSCVKGRAMPELFNGPQRQLTSLRRDGAAWHPISSEQAMDEIAVAVERLIDEHGPRSVAIYTGTHAFLGSEVTAPIMTSFAEAIGTPMQFTPLTIDMPGKVIAYGLHGAWMAPTPGFPAADVGLIVGSNPMVSHLAGPSGHPGSWLAHFTSGEASLIVIDPRRTETARRAVLHLQPRPGEDVAIVAAMLHVIIAEGLHDSSFLAQHADGLDALADAVRPFTPEMAAGRAGVVADDIVTAARMFARARYAFGIVGTGPNMAQSGTLLEYLMLCLQTVCGHWAQPGDAIANPGTLKPSGAFRAQATGPWPVVDVGEPMRVHGLTTSAAGPPTGALSDEMLLDGPGKVRALICVGGNPAVSWPDQARALDALRQLELLVQIDPFMSQTAQLAHYVIAPTIAVERPSTSQFAADHAGGGFGRANAYGQYVPAAVAPPAGSDVIDEWEFFYGLARRMGLRLALAPMMTYRSRVPAAVETVITDGPTPTLDDLLAIVTGGSRIALDEVKRHRHGRAFPDDTLVVQSAADGWSARFDIGNPDMIADLTAMITATITAALARASEQPRPFALISRRMMHVYNSSFNAPATHRGRPYNPAFLHPDDLDALGIDAGDDVTITSDTGRIVAVAEADAAVRRGCVSMAHAFGDVHDGSEHALGSSTARLLSVQGPFDRYSGQPRMSGVPVSVARAHASR